MSSKTKPKPKSKSLSFVIGGRRTGPVADLVNVLDGPNPVQGFGKRSRAPYRDRRGGRKTPNHVAHRDVDPIVVKMAVSSKIVTGSDDESEGIE